MIQLDDGFIADKGLITHHDGEDTFLHLSGILGTEDDHLHALEVDFNGGCGRHALRESVGGELTGIVDDEVGFTEVLQLFFSGSDKHVVLRVDGSK